VELTSLTILLASLLAGLSVLLLVGGALALQTSNPLRDRVSTYLSGASAEPVTLQEIELSQPFVERAIMPLVRQVARIFARLWPQNRLQALRQRLAQAGQAALSPGDFMGVKGLLMGLVVGLALLIGWATSYPFDYFAALMLGGLAITSFFMPDVWLSRKIAQRQQALLLLLPDALDMLVIAIEAGLSFEGAVQEVVEKSRGELAREFARVLRDISMGKSRRVALSEMADRTGVPDIVSFVTAMNQAEELGVSIGRILANQAEELRIRRRQRAQEKANQAPIKMLFPIVFLIFPSIFAVLLGPAVPQLLDMFTRTGG
jgi:tight adherence protein C